MWSSVAVSILIVLSIMSGVRCRRDEVLGSVSKENIMQTLKQRLPTMLESVKRGDFQCTCHQQCHKYSEVRKCVHCCYHNIRKDKIRKQLDKLGSPWFPSVLTTLSRNILYDEIE